MLVLPTKMEAGNVRSIHRCAGRGTQPAGSGHDPRDLTERGYRAVVTRDADDIAEQVDAAALDVVVFGGQVAQQQKAEMRAALSAVSPDLAFLQGLAGIPGLIVDQVESWTTRELSIPGQAPTYDPRAREIELGSSRRCPRRSPSTGSQSSCRPTPRARRSCWPTAPSPRGGTPSASLTTSRSTSGSQQCGPARRPGRSPSGRADERTARRTRAGPHPRPPDVADQPGLRPLPPDSSPRPSPSRRPGCAATTTVSSPPSTRAGPSSQADLARGTGVDRSDVVAVLGTLEHRGWSAGARPRQPAGAHRHRDRRRQEALHALDRFVDAAQERVLAPLTAQESASGSSPSCARLEDPA